MSRRTLIPLLLAVALLAPTARGQSTQPADPTAALGVLRADLIDSFVKGDLPRLLSHLDDDVVVTWQNGEVCRGPAAVKGYYEKMMTAPGHIVKSVRADPHIADRHVYGDWAVSWGTMNDTFELNDGHTFAMDSRFTATTARRGDQWKIVAFHVSANVFDNDVMRYAVRKSAAWTAAAAGVGGLVVGAAAVAVLKRRKRTV